MTRSFAEAGPSADMGEEWEDREAWLREIAAETERRQEEDRAYWAGYFATQVVME